MACSPEKQQKPYHRCFETTVASPQLGYLDEQTAPGEVRFWKPPSVTEGPAFNFFWLIDTMGKFWKLQNPLYAFENLSPTKSNPHEFLQIGGLREEVFL